MSNKQIINRIEKATAEADQLEHVKMKDKDLKAMKEAWKSVPSQDNEGYVPDRGGFKCGWFMALDYRKEEIAEKEAALSAALAEISRLSGLYQCPACGEECANEPSNFKSYGAIQVENKQLLTAGRGLVGALDKLCSGEFRDNNVDGIANEAIAQYGKLFKEGK